MNYKLVRHTFLRSSVHSESVMVSGGNDAIPVLDFDFDRFWPEGSVITSEAGLGHFSKNAE